jgi:hypothetical protein
METIGFISIGILIVAQIATFAFYFGRLNGKVDSIDKRLNDLSHRFDKIEERVHQLEVKR